MRTRGQAGTAIDTAFLASAYNVDEGSVQTLLDEPTAELVRSFLSSVTAKAEEFEQVRGEKVQREVELDSTTRKNEAKLKAFKATTAKQQHEVEDLRQKVNESEDARATLQSEVGRLKSSSTGSAGEVQALHSRISKLEASNRDALALVEAKSTAHDSLADELSAQHQKILALRREASALEEKNQALENASSSTKFKEQALQQEVELVKRNNEWQQNELSTRGAEHSNFRKEKNARISELQRANEDATSSIDALKRTETTLRQRLDDVQQKLDEAYSKIQQQQEAAAKDQQDFRIELDSSRRLADLQKQNADTHKARLQELQNGIEQMREDAANEVGKLQAEVETERGNKEEAERQIAELELAVERLETVAASRSRPGTPQRGMNGFLDPHTPGRAGSRTGSPAPGMTPGRSGMKGGLSFTQLYSEYNNMQAELEGERRRTAKLSAAMDEMLNDVEGRAPEIEELRQDSARLEAEVLDFSRMLDEMTATKNEAVKEANVWQGQAEGAAKEGNILRQQLRDLSAQVKILLVEVQARDQGLEPLSAAEQRELERAARGELDGDALENVSDTSRIISQRFVIFRDVRQLQEQNEQMLRITRELGDKLEGEEAQAAQQQVHADGQELGKLRADVERYKDELQSTQTQINSYMKERDMFRRMLQHRGQLQPDADLQGMFGQSHNGGVPATPSRSAFGQSTVDQTPQSREISDYAKLLKEHQAFFDAFREESTTDRAALKQQVDSLARENSNLQADLAKGSSQLTLAQDRYHMLIGNFNALKVENNELQKRSHVLAENAARQDLRTQQVVEELVEARSMADSVRFETANLKAERELWKRIESRLTEDNRSLMDERSRLNKMHTDLQNLHNERELTDSETRRRLQSRTEALEAELEGLKKKLEAEVDEGRRAALRREYESDQNRTRIDDLVKSLSNTREELVAAKTMRDQLQSRVDEMKIELRSAEEKVVALQPRPTPRADAAETIGSTAANGDVELSREQNLAVEVSELKRDLELTRGELESARAQVKQYKAISQSTEEDLANLNETSDQYRLEMDTLLSEKDARITELSQRADDLSAELTTTNAELSTLRTQHESSATLLADQKAASDADLARLNDDAERHAEEKKLYQQDLQAQAEIAQTAQQAYEDELVKHAEAAKALQRVRAEHNQLRTEVAGVRAEAEAARQVVVQNQESWAESRERYEREFGELKTRREDVDGQNKLLHRQLETFSAELAALRTGRMDAAGEQPGAAQPGGSSAGNLQEVINFLRREKEIVDVQYELSMQEGKRVQQQFEYAQSQLEDARQKLAEERGAQADKEATAGSHNKLVQTINELNLFRESSTTLRNEARQAQAQLAAKVGEVETLHAKVQPLQARVSELEGELEAKDGELKLLQHDRDHWRERTQNIISKYDRVDPAELEALKTRIAEVEGEKERLEAEREPLQKRIDAVEERVRLVAEESRAEKESALNRFKEQAKTKNREQTGKINELVGQVGAARAELENLKKELETTKAAREDAVARADAASKSNIAGDEEDGEVNEDGRAATGGQDAAALEARATAAEAQAKEQAGRANGLAEEVATLQSRALALEGQVAELQQQLETAQNEVTQSADQTGAALDAITVEQIKVLNQDLATAQQELNTLRANATSVPAPPGDTTMTDADATGEDSNGQSFADRVAAEVAKLRAELVSQHELATVQLEEAHKAQVERMKGSFTRRLSEDKGRIREEITQDLTAKHAEEIQKLKEEHEAALDALKAAQHAEMERLRKEGGVAVEKAGGEPATQQQTAETSVKTETAATAQSAALEISDEQAKELVQNNAVLKRILANNIHKRVQIDTAKLREENEALKAEKSAAGPLDGSDGAGESSLQSAVSSALAGVDHKACEEELAKEKAEHEQAMAERKASYATEKERAMTNAVKTAELKQRLLLGRAQKDAAAAEAKVKIVETAAQETPQRPVVDVWQVAKKATAAPAGAGIKPPGATSATTAPGSGAAASSPTINELPSAPSQYSPPGQQQPASTFGKPSALTFGHSSALGFGNASAPLAGEPNALQQSAPLSQPARGPSGQTGTAGAGGQQPLVSFTGQPPFGIGRVGATGIPQPGGSRLPTARSGPFQQGPGLSFQGAAGLQNQTPRGLPPRPNFLRPGENAGRGGRGGGGRGGQQGGGGSPFNTSGGAGQKRQHDGEGGGDAKRSRGGMGGGA